MKTLAAKDAYQAILPAFISGWDGKTLRRASRSGCAIKKRWRGPRPRSNGATPCVASNKGCIRPIENPRRLLQ